MRIGIDQSTYFLWKKQYAGVLPTEMKRLTPLEDKNIRPKKKIEA